MQAWVLYHSLTSLEDFLMWELDTHQYDAITVYFPSRDTSQPDSLVSLKPNSIRHNATTRSTPPPKWAVNTHDTDPHPEHPPTDTPTGDPTSPDSPAAPDLDNTEPCEAFTFDDSTLEHLMDASSPSYSVNKTHIYHVSTHSSSHYGSLI